MVFVKHFKRKKRYKLMNRFKCFSSPNRILYFGGRETLKIKKAPEERRGRP